MWLRQSAHLYKHKDRGGLAVQQCRVCWRCICNCQGVAKQHTCTWPQTGQLILQHTSAVTRPVPGTHTEKSAAPAPHELGAALAVPNNAEHS